MIFWDYIWLLVIIFSISTFAYMSLKIVYKAIEELKVMFKDLVK